MPKRLCPFEDSLMPQVKTHVTQKEYNLNTGKGMDNIYNKTTAMLFKGVKKLYDDKAKLDQESDSNKQLANETKDMPCTSCKQNNKTASKCWYCDKTFCLNCIGSCVKCKEFHCKSCSIESYEETFSTGLICLSCYNNC